eukprot:CAMPEP_0176482958 /NCGR_PEP_ID=MMETSP0200_2-20121128/3661_1 /TAXON_ID=947934 /ORGANISM="Chaetoceros sp., Strain GSL56" /LENGTH=286 /DNA_ID=CAMNT_0017879325 /DNA_START=509 /DNA_END=1369 /DNA_ORIENTATION=+
MLMSSGNNPSSSSSTNDVQNTESYSLATEESLGFFTDIDGQSWKLLKERFQKSRPNEYRGSRKIFREHANHPNYFWQENYDPEFTCRHEAKFGGLGDGGKWVCDPHRIAGQNNCLVYSIGSHGDFSFESSVLNEVSANCEIHTFDRDKQFNKKHFDVLAKEAGVNFHHLMLGEPTEKYPNGKRFREIIKDLKHEGRVIDIMKIDCEGCEWQQYKEWIEDFQETKVTIRQILMELHQSPLPDVVDFFHKMWEVGYVIFHKEANFLNPNCVEIAFVLLDKEFQSNVAA